MRLRVRTLSFEAEGVLGIELVPLAAGERLPPFDAGAHVDLHLPCPDGPLVRSYSLLNEPGERHRYAIAVNRDAKSRGGSRWIHESLRPGVVLEVDPPRNHFPLVETAPLSVLIAGGIGITPLLAMARRLNTIGRRWVLHHAVRSRAHAAFAALLDELADEGRGDVVRHVDDECGGFLDVAALIDALPAGAHAYCCGPRPMLEAFETATRHWPRERVHLEYFAAKDTPASAGGFDVRLRRSGRVVAVPAGRTILDALIAAGLEPLHSCREGICGTCETAVLAGTPDHRDLVLSDAEKAANDRIMICCSGAKTAELELDL